jgi:lipoprotein-anchoring transpeptidase ErfK/SrfK
MKQFAAALASIFVLLLVSAVPAAQASSFLDEINNSLQDVGSGPAGPDVGKDVSLPAPSTSKFRRQTVKYVTGEAPGTIVIDTNRKFLYYVVGGGKAIRYGIGVGREGFGWHGIVHVGRKEEWPAWKPPEEMIARERKRGKYLPEYVAGGAGNPLGARALYLFDGFFDNGYRIHGTTEPGSIGHNVSSGCIRLLNRDVIDLYNRTPIGTKVIVL